MPKKIDGKTCVIMMLINQREWIILRALYILLLCFILTGCHPSIDPMSDPEIDLFTSFHVEDEFTIYKRTSIENQLYTMEGYPIDNGYLLGQVHLDNYRVFYEDEYYTLLQGYELGLYQAQDLLDYGVTGLSRYCQADDTCD